jgi:hypothetical protein
MTLKPRLAPGLLVAVAMSARLSADEYQVNETELNSTT